MHIRARYPKIFRLSEVHSLAKAFGVKESNFERRLRASESPEIKTEYTDKNEVMGYTYREEYLPEQLTPPSTATLKEAYPPSSQKS